MAGGPISLPSTCFNDTRTIYSFGTSNYSEPWCGRFGKTGRFHIDAWVILPDPLHCVWTLPPGDDDFTNRWGMIKQGFSKALPMTERRSSVRIARGERGLWQRRFWEHAIRDDGDYATHVDYCHINPLKQGYVKRVADWPYSTFHRYVERGVYPLDWADEPESDLEAGERA